MRQSGYFPDNRAEVKLAKLIEKEMNCFIEPERLKEFLRNNWNVASLYAHQIHQQMVKEQSERYNAHGE